MTLIYYPDTRPGIRRRRQGPGFSYFASDGTRIDCREERHRLQALAVPPAYEDVWISPHRHGHLQATGRDARRRKQYRYHPDWAAQRASQKYDRLSDFARALPSLRRWIVDRLNGDVGDFETAVAATLALIDRASLRVGSPEYAAENGSYGATTLRNRHVSFDGAQILLDYTAKGGTKVRQRIYGASLQRVLQRSRELPGAELITWLDDQGEARIVRSEHLQDVLASVCGAEATAKTLRTWGGSHSAFATAMTDEVLTIKAMCEAAAKRLHNTPAIARSSYIHPRIIALTELESEERSALLKRLKPKPRPGLRRCEAELLAFLSS